MMMANMALQMAQQSPPGMFNLEALNRTILNAANMPNVEEILPPKIQPKPMDPVSDIMAATKGIPIAAFSRTESRCTYSGKDGLSSRSHEWS